MNKSDNLIIPPFPCQIPRGSSVMFVVKVPRPLGFVFNYYYFDFGYSYSTHYKRIQINVWYCQSMWFVCK